MKVLNSSGLIVDIDEAVPTVSGFGAPLWVRGTVTDPVVSPTLRASVENDAGSGRFSLGGRVTGIRGSILVSILTGATGIQRTLGYLTDDPVTPTRRIVLGIDGLNRPFLSIRDYFGTERALVTPSYTSIGQGAQVTFVMSWDSTQAIDVTRFALLQVNRSAIPAGDWLVNPVASWTSFQPTYVVLGFGVGTDSDFNGQIVSFQISNDTVQGGAGAGGQAPSTRVFDRFLNDTVAASTT